MSHPLFLFAMRCAGSARHLQPSRTFRRRRRDAFSAVDREDDRRDHEDEEEEEEKEEGDGEYWGGGREDHGGEDYGGGFDLVDDVLSDEADDDGNGGDDNGYGDFDSDDREERSHRYGSGDEGSRRDNRRSRGAAFEGVARPSRRSAGTRRRSFEGGLPPAGREKKTASLMKSVGSATGRSVKAVVQTLQPKSVGIGEILDTWKIEQVRGVIQTLVILAFGGRRRVRLLSCVLGFLSVGGNGRDIALSSIWWNDCRVIGEILSDHSASIVERKRANFRGHPESCLLLHQDPSNDTQTNLLNAQNKRRGRGAVIKLAGSVCADVPR